MTKTKKEFRAWVAILITDKDGFQWVKLGKRGPECGNPGKWGLPGGGVDENEGFYAAAQRELFEETGVMVATTDEFTHAFVSQMGNRVMHYFEYDLNEGPAPEFKLTVETVEYKWYRIADFLEAKGTIKLDDLHFSAKRYLAWRYAFGENK